MSDKKQVSRRQFLNYTLTGVGGFMAAGMLAPMVRFAIDPVLKPSAAGEFAAVVEESEITNEPQRFNWKVDQKDGWYESEVEKNAWVYKDENGEIVALSPICTHLGCTVDWNSQEQFPDEFYCPCHGGRYTKDGVNVPNTPPTAPLPVYEHKVEEGMLYLGQAISRGSGI
ncbi:menaquinol-cytochrome C reductase iron-sulfur subunit [Thalassobacillus devorans]|uniref:Menaquinol-cytochrome C reductase iron-sulfur subunit n=1 Tax=Thalassobacillus devorans TaxID=279813 RepID=A0ABQ1NZA4_9BACI|nr:ubiquinol-cytochrome c reductase iron-sulfur subunit [Thalassobacillus devorans]NIK28295.1 menaquinol-cytochrome c reductase iron-sulfur subunit [Thalassobacillus devorans]GGC87377.1 menaquinol-cytochrome C reductase iron-sulfur subunit [Thalassobacillus devorans]